MSRESIAFLKKNGSSVGSEAGNARKLVISIAWLVNRYLFFSAKMMGLWLQREAMLCFASLFRSRFCFLKTEIRACRSLTRQRKIIKPWLCEYSLLKQFTKRNSIFLWRANWPTFPCQTGGNEKSIWDLNPCGDSNQLFVHFNFAKICKAKWNKKREAKLCVKNLNLRYFDAKFRFALLASLRSAIFSKTKKVNKFQKWKYLIFQQKFFNKN